MIEAGKQIYPCENVTATIYTFSIHVIISYFCYMSSLCTCDVVVAGQQSETNLKVEQRMA